MSFYTPNAVPSGVHYPALSAPLKDLQQKLNENIGRNYKAFKSQNRSSNTTRSSPNKKINPRELYGGSPEVFSNKRSVSLLNYGRRVETIQASQSPEPADYQETDSLPRL